MKYIPFGKSSSRTSEYSRKWKGALQYSLCTGVMSLVFLTLYTFLLQQNPMHPKTILITSMGVALFFGVAGFFNGPFTITEPSDRTKPKSHFE